ncbi:MAG TPA: hypothetical protein VF796_09960, partial [Humisphaera sp.]
MPRDRVLIFANPIAGRGLGEAIAHRLRAGLSAAGLDARLWLRPPSALTAEDLAGDVRTAIV